MAGLIAPQVHFGLGFRPQDDFATASLASALWHIQTNARTPLKAVGGVESDQGETGTGNEFAHNLFKTGYEMAEEITVVASAELLTHALVFGLGSSTPSGSAPVVYTVVPKARTNGGNSQLSPFTVLCQGGADGDIDGVLDEAHIGVVVEGFRLNVTTGVGRQNCTLTIRLRGTGKFASPSSLTMPAKISPSFAPSASLALTSLTNDYAAALTINSLEFEWDNDVQIRTLGGGTQTGYAIAKGIEFGQNRGGRLRINADFLATATEIDKARALTEGTCAFSIENGADEKVTITAQRVVLADPNFVESDRGVTLDVDHRLLWHSSNGLLTAVCRTAQANIGVAV